MLSTQKCEVVRLTESFPIENADRIVILDKGKITDIGTHEQLMSRNDAYLKLYNTFALS